MRHASVESRQYSHEPYRVDFTTTGLHSWSWNPRDRGGFLHVHFGVNGVALILFAGGYTPFEGEVISLCVTSAAYASVYIPTLNKVVTKDAGIVSFTYLAGQWVETAERSGSSSATLKRRVERLHVESLTCQNMSAAPLDERYMRFVYGKQLSTGHYLVTLGHHDTYGHHSYVYSGGRMDTQLREIASGYAQVPAVTRASWISSDGSQLYLLGDAYDEPSNNVLYQYSVADGVTVPSFIGTTPIGAGGLASVACAPAIGPHGVVAVASAPSPYNYILVSSNYGVSWSTIAYPDSKQPRFMCASGTYLYVMTDDGIYHCSVSSPSTWTTIESFSSGSSSYGVCRAIGSDHSIVYFVETEGRYYSPISESVDSVTSDMRYPYNAGDCIYGVSYARQLLGSVDVAAQGAITGGNIYVVGGGTTLFDPYYSYTFEPGYKGTYFIQGSAALTSVNIGASSDAWFTPIPCSVCYLA